MITAEVADAAFIEQIGPSLVAVVVTGVVGLVAAWVGRLWERRTARDAWLREQRIGAYTSVVERMRVALDAVQVATPRLAGLDEADQGVVLADYHEAVVALGRSIDVVLVVGPPPLIDAADACMTAVTAVYDTRMAAVGEGAGQEADDAWEAAWDLRRAFAEEARTLLAT